LLKRITRGHYSVMEISDCLKILERHSEAHPQGGCQPCSTDRAPPCCVRGPCSELAAQPPPADAADAEQAPQGQVLDLQAGAEEPPAGGEALAALLAEIPELRELHGGEAEPEPEAAAESRLRGLPSAAVAEEVLLQHQQRVAAHRAYEAAFRQVLKRGRAATALAYPAVVAAATKRFAGISGRVRAAGAALSERGAETQELAGLVRRLQALERQKLALMAASHLDRVRAMQPRFGPDPGDPLAAADGAETRRQIGRLDTDIEETVSEIRHALADLREEEMAMRS